MKNGADGITSDSDELYRMVVKEVRAPVSISAQEGSAQQFPCKQPVDYKIRDMRTLLVVCDAAVPTQIDARGPLFVVVNESIVHGSEITGVAKSVEAPDYLVFTFNSPLKGGTDYELQFDGTVTIKVVLSAGRKDTIIEKPQPFKNARFRFTTKPNVAISEAAGHLVIDSHVAVDGASLGNAKLSQKAASGKWEELKSAFMQQVDVGGQPSPIQIGEINIAGPKPPPKGPYKLEGLKDVFGKPLVYAPTKNAPPISVPKSKADAT